MQLMARPTTRKGRFLELREKMLARSVRRYDHARRQWSYSSGLVIVRGRPWIWEDRPIQMPLHLSQQSFAEQPPPTLLSWPGLFSCEPITQANPPHPSIYRPSYLEDIADGIHSRFALCETHSRRIKLRGKKIGRMNGFQRQIMGANWFARAERYWPRWDVLGRHPNPDDINNGDPYLGADDWKLPGPWPTGP
jgi:hypothetical protein